ncbi:MAG: aminotransferase class V-fold PLP-dependent enzyme, partial [Bacteroidales bacterium]|nr:aminotransferase class V-fold PLP-dependent enzyme [Bacteroidales bacterium]
VSMTHAYHEAQHIIKKHVNAGPDDVLLTLGQGMTSVINKFQRILGLRIPEQLKEYVMLNKDKNEGCFNIPEIDRPVVFVTHMEHHSNHTSWLETLADVVVLEPTKDMLVCPNQLKIELEKHKHRKHLYGAFSAASNVTGIIPPYYELAKLMHQYGGYAFIDFAASGPYVKMDMHPKDPEEQLDAIFFSPHKFLGGPGSSGVIIFNKEHYKNEIPDQPGGGTVEWTDRWGRKRYIDDIETREDGGTPGFLQTIRIALVIKLKEMIGVENIEAKEKELLDIAFPMLEKIPGLNILSGEHKNRIGVISFNHDTVHHNLLVKLLNDRYGIQVRGGCSCAGTYGHFLLNITEEISAKITKNIIDGNATTKPGWLRLSIHPTMTNEELIYVINAMAEVIQNIDEWKKPYYIDNKTNEWFHKDFPRKTPSDFASWFEFNK